MPVLPDRQQVEVTQIEVKSDPRELSHPLRILRLRAHSHVKVLVRHVPEQQSLLKLQMLPLAVQQVLLEQICPPWHIVPQPPQFW